MESPAHPVDPDLMDNQAQTGSQASQDPAGPQASPDLLGTLDPQGREAYPDNLDDKVMCGLNANANGISTSLTLVP